MKKFLTTYKQSLILLAAIIIGTIAGLIFGERITFLKPLGDLFLNLLLVIIVPLIFLTIASSIAKMKSPKRIGKILTNAIIVIVIMSIVAVGAGLLGTLFVELVEMEDKDTLMATLDLGEPAEAEDLTILDRTVQALSVDDFVSLFSRQNMIAIIVMSILFGIAANMSGEKAKPVVDFLDSATDIVMNLLKIIMYYAPIGLGVYFAVLIGTFGASLALGYAKTFIVYTLVSVVFFFVAYSVYAYIAGGKKGFKVFWGNILPATITALATCSSAASIPVNLATCKKMGIPDDIAEPVIPLGTNIHKDGSIIGSVFKIMFLVYLFGTTLTGGTVLQILGVALIATLLVTAVPIGGGTISEMMILVMMGYPIGALPVLTIIATIIDAPATALNVVGDVSTAMLTARATDGKDWMQE
ncbi:MAG: dicarboxylate/amino acid:cation symporter [Clostridiales bacterium]|nr:dicarboxylate/amino acid:cation symporter [Clostridiales bacterium]